MDLPIAPTDPTLTTAIALAFDVEGRIDDALAALGPVADRDVVLLDGDGGRRQAALEARGGRVRALDGLVVDRLDDAAADVVIGCWTGLGLGDVLAGGRLAGLDRVTRPGGRLLLVEDYGRDDLRPLYADPARDERLQAASDRRGPMRAAGFRVRTLHCNWTFPGAADAGALLMSLFPVTGAALAETIRRPRLEHKVALYHRQRP